MQTFFHWDHLFTRTADICLRCGLALVDLVLGFAAACCILVIQHSEQLFAMLVCVRLPFVTMFAGTGLAMMYVQDAVCVRGTHDVFNDEARPSSFPRPFQLARFVSDDVSDGVCSPFSHLPVFGCHSQRRCPQFPR